MRLRHSLVASPGIQRIRRGRGFSYRDSNDDPVQDPELLARIAALVIPPAWKKVWICPYSNGHIQAVGTDTAGRKQYLYHEQWRQDRDEEKHERVLALAKMLPVLRSTIDSDLKSSGLNQKRVLAASLRMIDLGIFRTGGEEYTEDNDSYGAATLLQEHVSVQGNQINFAYPAKGNIWREVSIRDSALAAATRSLLQSKSSSDRLFVYRTGSTWHELHAADINARFKEITGEEFSVKDLRTWNATVLAASAFASQEPAQSKRARASAEAAVMKEVSEALGNTPAVTRKSYVDPRVISAYAENLTIRAAHDRARKAQSEEESRAILEKATIRLINKISK